MNGGRVSSRVGWVRLRGMPHAPMKTKASPLSGRIMVTAGSCMEYSLLGGHKAEVFGKWFVPAAPQRAATLRAAAAGPPHHTAAHPRIPAPGNMANTHTGGCPLSSLTKGASCSVENMRKYRDNVGQQKAAKTPLSLRWL